MAKEESCQFGLILKDNQCHKTTIIKEVGLTNIYDLSENDLELLKLRCDDDYQYDELAVSQNPTICNHHKALYISSYFESHQVICCDPFKHHSKSTSKKRKKQRAVKGKEMIFIQLIV
jgi:hypothetical protein